MNWDILAEGRSPRRYQPGQIIYLQGTQPDHFYYLLSGTARSFISTQSGEERVLTVHRAGDLMGEASFFDQCPRVTSAMAVTECQAVPVDQRQLNEMFSRHPELAVPMLQYLARTVRMLSGHVDNATLPARQRVARYLLSILPAGDCLCHTFSSGALRSAWRRDRLPGWHPYSCGPCPRSRPPCTHRCRTWPSGPGPACRWGPRPGR